MISERYKRLRFEEGKRIGRKEALKEQQERVEKILAEFGEEVSPEIRKRLLSEFEDQSP